MKRPLKYRNNTTESLNLWPSFTDLMANAFMIISLFLLLALFKSLFLKYTAEETEVDLTQTERQVRILKRQLALLDNRLSEKDLENENLKSELGQSIDNIEQLKKGALALENQLQLSNNQLQLSNSQNNNLELENRKLKSAPPVVVIQDSGEFQFSSGSANLPKELKNYISNNLVDRIEAISQQRNFYVVEIIGHTDGQVNFNSTSNLDENLEAVARGNRNIDTLVPGSNADFRSSKTTPISSKKRQT